MGHLDNENKDLLAEFARGAELIFENAEQLWKEACILHEHGALSRALVLHQLSNEELAKVDMLGDVCARTAMGLPVDVAKLTKAFGRHEAKNHANAYYSPMSDEERAARDSGDYAACRDIFGKQKDALHREFNERKNSAIYVDYRDGRFSAPKEAVTDADVTQLRAINAYLLQTMHPFVRWMRKLSADQTVFLEFTTALAERATELLKLTPSDRIKAFNDAVREVYAGTGPVVEKVIALCAPTALETAPPKEGELAGGRSQLRS